MALPTELAPGLFHWPTLHPDIKVRVSSYYLSKARVLIDPLLPSPDGLKWLKRRGPPEHILLTSRLHSRHSARLVEAFGCTVWCHQAGVAHLAKLDAPITARGFKPGDALPGGATAFKIGVLCPDESAILLPSVRAAAVADGVIRARFRGALGFVPDELLADDPSKAGAVKKGLTAAYRRLAAEDFDHLLMAHGAPWMEDGREALAAWAGKSR